MSNTPAEFAAAVQALAAAVLAGATDPYQGVGIMTELANFNPTQSAPNSPQGNAIAAMQDAVGDLCRRAAVTALARASSVYQPSSYEDAASLRALVCGLLDNEILVAGDQGEDTTYGALRTLRAAVAQDLTTRGATLAHIKTFTVKSSLPADVLATRLYSDPSRADQLVAQADPVHPAFMPVVVQALAE
ncbi:MAG: hypothetical protein KGI37_07770 [Alphaproteobacteria bacterium]|nr:hypothetical protein [Alphaproteobacteria bacterium]